MPYVAYLRKSRADLEAEAHGEGETLARHRDALNRLADRMGICINAYYEEIVSGDTISARPKMQQLLREVESGVWEGVLVVEVERLARGDSIDQGVVARAFKYSETKIITPSKTFDPANEFDEEYFEFGLFMSRREYKTIRRRLSAGVQAARREGKFTGGTPPYGYRKTKLKKQKGGSLEIIPEQAELVRRIYRLFIEEQLNLTQICKKLNDEQLKTLGGWRWSQQAIRNMLTNPHYAGYTTSTKRPVKKAVSDGTIRVLRPKEKDLTLYEGLHEPIIPRDIWNLVQKRMQTHVTPPVPRGKGQKNALRGLLVCTACGHKMQRGDFGKNANRHSYFTCLEGRHGCPTISNDYDETVSIVLNTLRGWLSKYDVSVSPVDAKPELEQYRTMIAKLDAEMQVVKDRQSKAFELVETGIYSPDIYVQRKSELEAQEVALLQKKDHIKKMMSAINQREQLYKAFLPQVQHVLDTFDSAENANEQNILLSSVIDHIDYTKTKRKTPNYPGNLTLTVYPLLPSI